MNKGIWIGGSIVLALILMGASFYGGTLYQKNAQTSAQARFLASRGLSGGGFGGGGNFTGPEGTPGAGGGGRGFGGGAQGSVKSIDGNTLTISTAQNVTTVTLSGNTTIMKSDPGTVADLKVGDRVLVTGQRDSSGNITASQVMVLALAGSAGAGGNGGSAGGPTPTP
jgi:hypothetical protein